MKDIFVLKHCDTELLVLLTKCIFFSLLTCKNNILKHDLIWCHFSLKIICRIFCVKFCENCVVEDVILREFWIIWKWRLYFSFILYTNKTFFVKFLIFFFKYLTPSGWASYTYHIGCVKFISLSTTIFEWWFLFYIIIDFF